MGHLLGVRVHAANRHDTRTGLGLCWTAVKYPSLQAFAADQGYRGMTLAFVEEGLTDGPTGVVSIPDMLNVHSGKETKSGILSLALLRSVQPPIVLLGQGQFVGRPRSAQQ